MTHLVYNRKYIFERIGIVEQDIRLAVVGTEAIGAAGLALILVDIDPAVLRAVVNLREILVTQRRETFLHHAECLLIRNILFWQFHQRNVHVVHFEFLHTEHFFAQRDIAVQDRQIFVHDRDEVIIDLLRNIARGKGGLPGGIILADTRGNDVVFDVIVVGGRNRVDMRLVSLVHIGKRGLAQVAVMAFHEGDIVSMRKVYRISIFVNYCAEGQVGIVEHFEDVVGRACHFAELGENVFLGGAEHMLLLAERIFERVAVLRQIRFCIKIAADGFLRRCEQLRGEERHSSRGLCHSAAALIVHGLVFADAVVLIFAHRGIDKGVLQLAPDGVLFGEGLV